MADNFGVKDAAGATKTIAAKDTGSVYTPHHRDTELHALVGEVGASPTANTLADRLKVLNTTLTATNTKLDELMALIGEVSATPTANTVLDRLKTIGTNTTP